MLHRPWWSSVGYQPAGSCSSPSNDRKTRGVRLPAVSTAVVPLSAQCSTVPVLQRGAVPTTAASWSWLQRHNNKRSGSCSTMSSQTETDKDVHDNKRSGSCSTMSSQTETDKEVHDKLPLCYQCESICL